MGKQFQQQDFARSATSQPGRREEEEQYPDSDRSRDSSTERYVQVTSGIYAPKGDELVTSKG